MRAPFGMAYTTQQKLAVESVIKSSERPLTPVEICEMAQADVPALGIATVYRTIKQYVAEGSVRLVDVPGAPPHYESANRRHHHFFLCNQCRRLFDLVGCSRGIEALAPKGFHVERHEIILYGDCKECLAHG